MVVGTAQERLCPPYTLILPFSFRYKLIQIGSGENGKLYRRVVVLQRGIAHG
jgi:hypothetical protein